MVHGLDHPVAPDLFTFDELVQIVHSSAGHTGRFQFLHPVRVAAPAHDSTNQGNQVCTVGNAIGIGDEAWINDQISPPDCRSDLLAP